MIVHRDRAEDGPVRRHLAERRRSEVQLPDALVYRGMLVTGVPNMAFAFGYVNQSWTLGCDLACQQVCRMLRHMDEHGYTHCTPMRPEGVTASLPFAELSSGYVQRAMHQFPRQAPTPRGAGTRTTCATGAKLAPDPCRRRSARLLDGRPGRRRRLASEIAA